MKGIMSRLIIIVILILFSSFACQNNISNERTAELISQARTALEEKKPEEAEHILSRVHDFPEKHYLYGRILSAKGKYEEALKEYSVVTEKDGELYPQALCGIGELEMSRGDIKTARKFYSLALKKAPFFSDARLGMAEVYIESGQAQSAIREILIVEEKSPGGEYLGVLKARALIHLNLFKEAEEALKQNIKQHPDSIQSSLILAGMYADKGKIKEAQTLLSDALLLKPDGDAKKEILQLQARNYSLLGDDRNFQKVLNELTREYPERWYAHQIKGEVLFASGKWQESAREFETALTYSPGSSDIHLNLAHLYYTMRDREKARKHYEKVLEKEPDHLESIMFLADIAIREHRFDDARKIIERAEKLNPGLSLIIANANIAIEERNFAKAEKLYNKVIEVSPSNENALWGLGNIALLRGDYSKAEWYFEKELKTDPDNFSVQISLSEVLEALNRKDESEKVILKAEVEITKILSEMPNNDEAWAALGRLKADRFDYKSAMTALKKSLDLRKNFTGAKIGIAYIMLKDGEEQEGEKLMKQVLDEYPGEVEGRHLLADYYMKKKRYDEAIAQAKIAYNNLPGNMIAIKHIITALENSGKRNEAGRLLEEIKKNNDLFITQPK